MGSAASPKRTKDKDKWKGFTLQRLFVNLDESSLIDMTFQFLLQSTPIEHSEAVALMKAAQNKESGPFEIDLEKVINISKIDSKKLFDMAVKHENPDLATLAFKMSVRHKDAPKAAAVSTAVRTPRVPEMAVGATIEDLIAKLHDSNNYWATGAALLVASTQRNDWTTLKDVAVNYVNKVWRESDISEKSVLFRGFRSEDSGLGPMWQPLELQPGVERKMTFHVSPIYIGLREGLLWCRKNDLVEQKSGISVGTVRANASSSANSMQRVYYKIKATEKGEKMKALWGDVDNYIYNFFKSRSM